MRRKRTKSIEQAWQRVESWLERNAPIVLSGLRYGATEDQIAKAEEVLGIVFPEDVRASFKIHDGQETDSSYSAVGGGLLDMHDLLSLDGIISNWRVWKGLYDSGTFSEAESDPDTEIRQFWWNPKWIPLTQNATGDHYCVDLDPSTDGTVGQIISMWHDAPEREVLAGSFTEWIVELAQNLEDGEIVYSENDGCLMNKDDL